MRWKSDIVTVKNVWSNTFTPKDSSEPVEYFKADVFTSGEPLESILCSRKAFEAVSDVATPFDAVLVAGVGRGGKLRITDFELF